MLILSEKLVLFSRYLSFCLDFSVMYQNGLIKMMRLTSNFMMSHPGQQTIVIHMFPNILRSIDSQSTECNMRNIFLEKSYTKYGGETSSDPFSEKLKLTKSLDRWFKVLYSLFILNCRSRAIKIY